MAVVPLSRRLRYFLCLKNRATIARHVTGPVRGLVPRLEHHGEAHMPLLADLHARWYQEHHRAADPPGYLLAFRGWIVGRRCLSATRTAGNLTESTWGEIPTWVMVMVSRTSFDNMSQFNNI